MPKTHDTKIWERIVEAFGGIQVAGNPTAIAKELHMSQPAVRDWKIGATTPSRANIKAISEKTGYLSGYLEDAALPKKAIGLPATPSDPETVELLATWKDLSPINKGRLLEKASELLKTQFPDAGGSRTLQRN